MKMAATNEMEDDPRPEYDFSQLKNRVRGKYAERYKEGTNLILLAPDVAQAFPYSDSERGATAVDQSGEDEQSATAQSFDRRNRWCLSKLAHGEFSR